MVIVTQWSQTMKKPLLFLLLLLVALPTRAAEPHITISSAWTECSFPEEGIYFYRGQESATTIYAVAEITSIDDAMQLGLQQPWTWCGLAPVSMRCTLYGEQASCTIEVAKPPAVPGLNPVVLP